MATSWNKGKSDYVYGIKAFTVKVVGCWKKFPRVDVDSKLGQTLSCVTELALI